MSMKQKEKNLLACSAVCTIASSLGIILNLIYINNIVSVLLLAIVNMPLLLNICFKEKESVFVKRKFDHMGVNCVLLQ